MKYLSRFFLSISVISFFLVIGCSGAKQISSEKQKPLKKAQRYSAKKSGDALLVWIKGDLVLEDYQNGHDPNSPHTLTDASTLLYSLVALAVLDDGLFKLGDPVSETITEWKQDPKKSEITISELLHLTSGLKAYSYKSVPTYEKPISAPLLDNPSHEFNYGPTAFQVFGALVDRKVGGDYLKRRILKPIDIPGGRWLRASYPREEQLSKSMEEQLLKGVTIAPRIFDGAYLKARELLRIGILLVQNGKWNGKTIIDDLSPLSQATPASPGYGLGVWLNHDVSSPADSLFLNQLPEDIMLLRGLNNEKLIYDKAPSDLYMAAGRFNQRLYVIPSKKMVIVRLGRADLRWSDAEFLSMLLQN